MITRVSVRRSDDQTVLTNVYLTPEFFLLFVLLDLELPSHCGIRNLYPLFGVEHIKRFWNDLICVKRIVEGMILGLDEKVPYIITAAIQMK